MYITLEQRRKIMIASITLGILILLAIGVFAVVKLSNGKDETASKAEQPQATTPTQQAGKEPEPEEPEDIPLPYTQYDEETSSCKYYYEDGSCYVPLSYCVPDAAIKTPRELDREKYCSETPELKARSLQTEGSACLFTATEGDIVNIRSIVQDPDESDPRNPVGPLGRLDVRFSYPFADSNGVWQTLKGDAGMHNFTVRVTDGEYTEEKPYCIEVLQGNRPPALGNLNNLEVVAGETVKLEPTCTDPDNDEVKITYQGDISNRNWITESAKKTEPKDVGRHIITVSCTDARGLTTYKSIVVFVWSQAPQVTGALQMILEANEVTVREGETVSIHPRVVSGSGREATIAYSGWMDSSEKQTDYNDAGTYQVTVTATDGVSTVSDAVTVHVLNVNRPPQIVNTERVR